MVFSYIVCCSREKAGTSWAVLWSGILFLLVFIIYISHRSVNESISNSDIWRERLSPLSAAKGLARRTQRSCAALRMTARTPLTSAHGKSSLQTPELDILPLTNPKILDIL